MRVFGVSFIDYENRDIDITIIGSNLKETRKFARKYAEKIKKENPDFKMIDVCGTFVFRYDGKKVSEILLFSRKLNIESNRGTV